MTTETDRLTIKIILRDAGLRPTVANGPAPPGVAPAEIADRYCLQYHKNKEGGGSFFLNLYAYPTPALRNALLDAQPPLQTRVVVKGGWGYPSTLLFMV